MPDNLRDLKSLTTFLKNFFSKATLLIKGDVNVQNLPKVQKVEVTNPTESHETVEVSNLSELKSSVEKSLADVVKAVNAVEKTAKGNKPEKAKEDLVKALTKIQKELSVKPVDNTPHITAKLDEVVKSVEKIDITTDLTPVVSEIQGLMEGLKVFESYTRFNEVRTYLNEKQLKKLVDAAKSSGTAMLQGGGGGPVEVTIDSGDELKAWTHDGTGTAITSTLVGGDQSLDVNVAQIASALPAGTNAIGKLAENIGVTIGDIGTLGTVTNDVNVNLQDGAGTDITSTTDGGVQGLDVQVNNTVTLGQALKASSIPVTIASDQISGTPTEKNLELTSQNTEYSYVLPNNTKILQFQTRTEVDIRWSYTTGKVAGSTDPFLTLKSGQIYYERELDLSSKTLYFATAETSSPVVEILSYA